MVVCKFYQQGKCKFGNQCRFEHVDNFDGRYNQRNRNHHDQGNRTRDSYKNDSQINSHQQRYGEPRRNDYQEDYSSPFTRNNKAANSSDRQGYQQNKQSYSSYSNSYNQRETYQDDNRSPFSRNNNWNQSQQNTNKNKDRFHWDRNSSKKSVSHTDPLPSSNQESQEDMAIVRTIQEDMTRWVESKMWPYSCYSCAKEMKSVEGLPDIQPEELRVLYRLHGIEFYQNIMKEMDLMYNRRKDELFTMSSETKMAMLSDLRSSIESNPSSILGIAALYGKGVEFPSSDKKEAGASAVQQPPVPQISTSNLPQQPAVTPLQLPVANTTSHLTETSPVLTTPSLFGQSNSALKPSTATAQFGGVTAAKSLPPSAAAGLMFKNASSIAPPPAADLTYTDRSVLTEAELGQFEAERFTLGEFPMRPPPKELCT